MIDIVALAALVAIVVLACRTNSLRLRIITLTSLLLIYLGRELIALVIANYAIAPATADQLFLAYAKTAAKDAVWLNLVYVCYEFLIMASLYALCVWGFVKEHASREKCDE